MISSRCLPMGGGHILVHSSRMDFIPPPPDSCSDYHNGIFMALRQQEWKWARKFVRKLSMTVKQGITSVSPDFNFITKKKNTKYKNNKRRCRRYISAKKKGKTARIGNKTSKKYVFLNSDSATHVCSSTSTTHANKTVKFDTNSYTIGVDNHASKCISNTISHFISALTPTPNTVLRGAGGNLKVKGKGTVK